MSKNTTLANAIRHLTPPTDNETPPDVSIWLTDGILLTGCRIILVGDDYLRVKRGDDTFVFNLAQVIAVTTAKGSAL